MVFCTMENPLRSMRSLLQAGQNVCSPSCPMTLPVYTKWSPSLNPISRARSRVATGVGGAES